VIVVEIIVKILLTYGVGWSNIEIFDHGSGNEEGHSKRDEKWLKENRM
jgi:hypothetical protein